MAVESTAIEGMRVGKLWGITPMEYTVTGVEGSLDFQDLMVAVSEQRAAAVEQEVNPLATRIKSRNTRLSTLGTALSALAKLEFDTSKDANPTSSTVTSFTDAEKALMVELGAWPSGQAQTNATWKKEYCDSAKQKVQTEIDRLNNLAQMDMTRMQGLVDHRDQSFNTATTMMQHISETRGTTIKGIS